MALKFLNKKGWHTGSLRNIENVWKAEQKAEAEKRKLEEVQKQIREEQDQFEFRKLQEQAGLVPRQERLDFLYESGLGVGKPSNDEYLLGKPLEESKGDDVLQQVAATPGSLFVEEKISANDQWRKIRSDPLLLIKQQELAARERIKNNPLKMEALRKEVDVQKKMKQERKEEKKRLKAEEKQKRKELKRKQKEGSEIKKGLEDGKVDEGKGPRHGSPVSDDDGDRSHGHERSRQRRREDYESGRDRGEDSRRRRHDSPVSDEDNGDRDRKRRRREDDGSSSSRDRTEDRRRHEETEDRRRHEETGDRRRHEDTGDRRRHDEHERGRNEDRRRQRSPEVPRGYGKPPLPKKNVQLTDEEREARLREMQQDAALHEEQRWSRIKKASVTDAIQEEKDAVKSSKNFLDQANRSLYGTEGSGNASVADTLHRRSHYREKFTDTNAFRKS